MGCLKGGVKRIPLERDKGGRICDLVHFGIGSHVGQAFLPDPVGQEGAVAQMTAYIRPHH